MNVRYGKYFHKSLSKLKNADLAGKVLDLVSELEKTEKFQDIPGILKLKGFSEYFRYRIGDYRIGLIYEKDKDFIGILIA